MKSERGGDCEGKFIYRSYYSAMRHAKFIREPGRNTVMPTPYRCKKCNAYHLTTRWKNLNKKDRPD